jgi:hypothetical protein
MPIPTYNQTLDTMVSTAIDTYSRDPINAFTDSGEKFLKTAAQLGRVFLVNDAENVRHPVMYDHGENSSLYAPDELTGTPDGLNNLSSTAKEILTHARFTLQAGTRNINMPQSQPPGNMIDYVASVVKANMMSILNQEECLFLRGGVAPTGTVLKKDAAIGDTDYDSGFPTNLYSILQASCTNTAQGDITAEPYAGIASTDIPKWEPYTVASTAANHTSMFSDIQNAILYTSYSEMERPTHIYMARQSFEKFLDLLRADAALPDPVRADMGKEGTIPFGGVTIDWSRYLYSSTSWDASGPVLEATYPIIGVNWNSLRLNTVRSGGVGDDSIGFIRQIGAMQPHPTLTNVFKRIEWKRQWSVDNGRRSFFLLYGNTSIA